MQKADANTVLGRFDGSRFVGDGITATFFKKEGKFWISTEGIDGKLTDFEVLYTFGLTPLQQYLVPLSGGRLQAFSIAWDSRSASDGGQRWYDLYPGRRIGPGDPLHWTGIEQNWNYQCAWCHSTDLRKNYDASSKSFDTKWSEINVGCEACHGPASDHIEWSKQSVDDRDKAPGKGFAISFDERRDLSWAVSGKGRVERAKPRTTAKEIGVCAGCHARRAQFSDNAQSAARFFDAFRASRLEAGLYHADGQQLDEVYNHGSFLQSRMHQAGVTCSDCHEPHSGSLRATGNGVCLQCHAADRFDSTAHHHHRPGTEGAACVSCHMPATIYMGVDARRDHSMRIPRPDRTEILGTPNACNQCHSDRTARWASTEVRKWFPSPKPGAQTFAEAFALGDRGAPGAQAALIRVAEDTSLSGIVRASAIARLGRFASPRVVDFLGRLLDVDEPDMRTATIQALSAADRDTRARLLGPLLTDSIRLVRMDAARELAGDAESILSSERKLQFDKALTEFVDAQRFNAERPEAHVSLGEVHLRRGRILEARAAFQEALQLDPTFAAAAVAMAEIERGQGNEAGAERVLTNSLTLNPKSGALLHALGLSLVRQKRLAEAIHWLAEAGKLAPEEPRFAYVYAVALQGTGRMAEAIEVLKAALDRHHYDRDILLALASYEIELRDFTSAVPRLKLLHELEPERIDVEQLLMRLQRAR